MAQLNIKIIDFTSINAAAKFTKSLKETGFASLKNHPIDMDLVNDVYMEWDNFFRSDKKAENCKGDNACTYSHKKV